MVGQPAMTRVHLTQMLFVANVPIRRESRIPATFGIVI